MRCHVHTLHTRRRRGGCLVRLSAEAPRILRA
jgi:hypothetical protein